MKNRKMGEEKRAQQHENVRALEAVVVAPGRKPRVTIIAGTFDALCSIVRGEPETMPFTAENMIVCNADAGRAGLPENRMGVHGTFIVLGRGENGRIESCRDARSVIELLREPEEAYAG